METTTSTATPPLRGAEATLQDLVDLLAKGEEILYTPPLADVLARAHAIVDTILSTVGDNPPTSATEYKEHLRELERLKRRIDAARLRLIAHAQEADAHEASGHTDSGSWVAGATDSDRRASQGDAHLADAFGTGTDEQDASAEGSAAPDADTDETNDTEPHDTGQGDKEQEGTQPGRRPRLTATADALAEGGISAEHAKVIARTLEDLPEHVTDEQYLTCEAELLALAINRSPSRLRAAARRVLAAIEPDPDVVDEDEDTTVADEEERAMEASAFWIRDNHDGTMTGHFTLPWASGMTLKKIIDAMTAPRRQNTPTRAGDHDTANGADGPRNSDGTHGGAAFRRPSDPKGTAIDWQHKRGLAFADLMARLPTDHLHNKTAATLLITIRLADLQQALTANKVATTDITGGVLSSGATRRLACGAGILPTVMDSDSVPIDLGRQTRLFTEAQRLALSTRYTECATEGCDRPFAWTETHHLRPWEAGGGTDMHNAVPLCGRHHHMIDSPRWRHATHHHGDGTAHITFRRRD